MTTLNVKQTEREHAVDGATPAGPHDVLIDDIPEMFRALDPGNNTEAESIQMAYGHNVRSLKPIQKFDMLSKDLKAPFAYLEAKRHEDAIAKKQKEIERLNLVARGDYSGPACPELRKVVDSALNEPPKANRTDLEKKECLNSAIHQLREEQQEFLRYPFMYSPPPAEQFKQRVREIYTDRTESKQLFEKHVRELMPEPDSETSEVQIAKIEKEIEKRRKAIRKIFYNNFPQHFFAAGKMPGSFAMNITSADVLKSDGSHQQNIALTMRICQFFFDTWKQRQKHFEELISVNCVCIDTMPPDVRELWTDLHRKAEIRPELHQPGYIPQPTRYRGYHYDHQPALRRY